MHVNQNLTIGQFGESTGLITMLLSAEGQPLHAMIILEAGYGRRAARVDLREDELRILAHAISGNAENSRIEDETMAFSISSMNRGEPYRDGYELCLSEKESYENTSCWMEERDAEMMLGMLKKRIAAEPAPDDMIPM